MIKVRIVEMFREGGITTTCALTSDGIFMSNPPSAVSWTIQNLTERNAAYGYIWLDIEA